MKRVFAITAAIVAISLLALAGGVVPPAAAQQTITSPGDTSLYRVQFNTFRSRVEDGLQVWYMEGDVRIDHQNATVTSERGRHYPELKHTILEGDVRGVDGTMRMFSDLGEYFATTNVLYMIDNVRLLDEGMEVTCRRAEYDRDNGTLILTGNVRLSDSTRVMYADSIFYDRNLETADAWRDVVIIDTSEDFSVSGMHGRFFRTTGEAIMYERPVLVFDDHAEEEGRVTSEWMSYNMEKDAGIAVGAVNMLKGRTRATCDSAAIFNDEGFIELFGNPVARSGPSGMTGERLLLYYNDKGVERIVLPEKGRLTEAPSPESPWTEDSWIEGDSIVIHMSDDQVDSVQIFGNARAMYYPFEGTENKVSNNYSMGDSMFFRFDGSDLRYVKISGNSTGSYNYLNLGPGESIDSLAAMVDSSIIFVEFSKEAEKISYEANEIEYFATSEDIVMHNGAKVNYQNKALTAEFINFSSRLNILDAHGDPALDENGQMMYGYGMGYDMETEGGLVMDGSTKYDQGYYLGKRIFKQGDDVLKVYSSKYTTCDYRTSHYSMRAGRMKVYLDDKIVSGPITLYIGEIPCFWLPYMVNSIRRGRQSGLLRPNFDVGINSRDGRFIRGFGYYWATNDYTDFILTTDFNENSSFRIHLTNRYKKRYVLGGNVNLDFFRDFNKSSYEWTLKSSHNQTFGKTASLRANLSFVSSDEAPSSVYRADDVARVVDRRIYSTASFNKNWGGTRLGLSASRNQKLNVSTDSPNEVSLSGTLPSLSFNLPRMSMWFGEKHTGSEKGLWEGILREVTWAPNLKATRSTTQSHARKTEEVTANSSASLSKQNKFLGLNISPSVGLNWAYAKTLKDEINPQYVTPPQPAVMTGDTVMVPITIDPSNNMLRIILNGWPSSPILITEGEYNAGAALAFELESSINTWDGWGSDQVTVDWLENEDGSGSFRFTSNLEGSESSLEFVDIPSSIYSTIGITPGIPVYGTNYSGATPNKKYKNEVSMRFSLGVGTTLYGVFYPNIGSLVGIRHTFNPSVSWSYVPALTDNQRESQGYSWSLRNIIDLKYLKDGQEAKKNNAFTWNMSGSFSPELKERQFSNIRSSIRTSVGRLASISLNNTLDPYEREILSSSFSANMSFGSGFTWPGSWTLPEREKIRVAKELGSDHEQELEDEEEDELDTYDGFVSDYEEQEDIWSDQTSGGRRPGAPGRGTSWSLNLGYSYSGFGGASTSKPTSKVDMRGSLNLTNNWKVTFSNYFDIQRRVFTSQQYSLTRDLHCWQAGFVHRRFGDEYSFYFQIQIKAHRDLKYEQGKRGLSGTVPGFLN